jgi:predicted dehydrogenase
VTEGPVGVGVIGAGTISKEYLSNLTSFPDLALHAVGDLFPEAAKQRAAEYGIETSGDVGAVLGHPDVEVVVNLTIPEAHADVGREAVAAGKHVWSEKPFALDLSSGRRLLTDADEAGVRLGCAPDTFLGAGVQTALRLINSGRIGTPLTGLTLMQSPGPESWHPNPAFLFQTGAGPLFDVGPYYLTALVQTFGAMASVGAFGSRSQDKRVIGSGPRAGEKFDVTVPTHVSAIARFASGQSSQSIFSFDSPKTNVGVVEITGTDATLSFPDPNEFVGDVTVAYRDRDPEIIPAAGATSTRGSGVLEMARAIRAGRPHRAQGLLAFHVLDAMASINESIETGQFVGLTSSAQPAEALPQDWDPTAATLR